jgi:lysozyme
VSAHQGRIDWPRVAGDDVEFAYVKATEGRDFVDRRFQANWAGARRAGLAVGAYHYFTLCSSGREQAAHFLATAPPDDDALAPAIDLEDVDGPCGPTRSGVQRRLTALLSIVEAAWGRPAVLYVGEHFRSRYPLHQLGRRPSWERRLVRRPDDTWTIWQCHWRAAIDGITGGVDLDVRR